MNKLLALAVLINLGTIAQAQTFSSAPTPSQNSTVTSANERTIRCESLDGKRTFCADDLANWRYRDHSRLSRAACVLGQSYGYDERGVWVAEGCRADFKFRYVGTQGRNPGGFGANRVIACASRDGRRNTCPSELRGYSLRDFRQSSRNACVEGETFGYDAQGVWVERGCRAEFEFVANDFGAAGRSEQRVLCESQRGSRANCTANLRGYQYRDMRQLSRAICELGRTFGYDERGVWTSDGCRAEFFFTVRGGYGSGFAQGSEIFVCESRDAQRRYCDIPPGYNVRLRRQLSNAACTQGSSWAMDSRGLWVDRGCRGEFELYR
jgi:hypothetical protein